MKLKTALLCSIALAAIFQVVHSQPNPTPTPIDISALHPDPKLINLTTIFGALVQEVQAIDHSFEVSIANPEQVALASLLDQIKVSTAKVQSFVTQVRVDISETPSRSFMNRLTVEIVRIQSEKLVRALKWISGEILGYQAGVSKFEEYYYSETVGVVEELLQSRFNTILLACVEVEKLLNDAHLNGASPQMGTVDKDTKAAVDKQFKLAIAGVDSANAEYSKDYYGELERIRLEGKELNVLQRMNAEINIDLLNYAKQFITKYDELWLRIEF